MRDGTPRVPACLWLAGVVLLALSAAAAQPSRVTAALPDPDDERIDEYGISVPISANHPGRRFPAEENFPSGPAIGERLPDFRLANQYGELVEFHASRKGRKAAIIFYRSAVW